MSPRASRLLLIAACLASLLLAGASVGSWYARQRLPREVIATRLGTPLPHFLDQGRLLLVSSTEYKPCEVWSVAERRVLTTIELDQAFDVCPERDLIAHVAGPRKDELVLVEARTGASRHVSLGASAHDVDLSPRGDRVAVCRRDGTVEVRSTRDGALEQKLSWSLPVKGVVFAPDGAHAAGGAETTACIWRLDTGAVVATIPGVVFGFTRKSEAIVLEIAANQDPKASLRSVEGRVVRVLAQGFGTFLTTAGAGVFAIQPGSEPILEVRSIETGEVLRTLPYDGHRERYDISPEGDAIAVGSFEKQGRVEIWTIPR